MVWETQRIECGLMRGREGQGWGLGPGVSGSRAGWLGSELCGGENG